MIKDVPKMSLFQWTPKREQAAILLSLGYTIDETAAEIGVSEKTIDRWKKDIEFSTEVDRLSLMTDVASRAERLRIAKRMIRELAGKRTPTSKDLLEWLKYAQSETDGAKIDIAALIENATSLAGSGQDGNGEIDEENGEG